ncbi:MAG TPA: hypothetical protein VGR20_12300, partial [Acidimicrobiia bacterium]|nr:hypothetical protein [Acidimicrobiia bacterium]
MRAWASPLPSDVDAHDHDHDEDEDGDGAELALAPCRARLAPVPFAAPRRRLTTGSHAEFVGALIYEFRGALASLMGATELLARRRQDLDEAVLDDLGT